MRYSGRLPEFESASVLLVVIEDKGSEEVELVLTPPLTPTPTQKSSESNLTLINLC